jgi:uncharacterized protein
MRGGISRRRLLQAGALAAGGAALGIGTGFGADGPGPGRSLRPSFGEPRRDPGGVLDLPPGFEYRVISREGGRLSNGATVPAEPDGMAAFARPDGATVLVRNHELKDDQGPAVEGSRPYDRGEPGGTTALVVGPDHHRLEEYVLSSGTRNNCAGGATPWGTYITVEEDRTERHGYAFEVDPARPEGELSKTPIREMGFFSHEALAFDPRTGVAYLTEDDFRGVVDRRDPARDTRSAFLYRFLPSDRRHRPGALQNGGRLEALAIEERPLANADFFAGGQRLGVVWRSVDPSEAHADALRKGCARFNRLEGCDFSAGALWFADTVGGEEHLGQVYRYLPATGTLELFIESSSRNRMQSPDSLVVAPWGDLLFCEDGDGHDRLIGIDPSGHTYELARNRLNDSELVGATFSPDGLTLFLSVQYPGITFAIWGPFPGRNPGRARAMAAGDPGELGPEISAELGEAAERERLSPLEAAALARLGVPLL